MRRPYLSPTLRRSQPLVAAGPAGAASFSIECGSTLDVQAWYAQRRNATFEIWSGSAFGDIWITIRRPSYAEFEAWSGSGFNDIWIENITKRSAVFSMQSASALSVDASRRGRVIREFGATAGSTLNVIADHTLYRNSSAAMQAGSVLLPNGGYKRLRNSRFDALGSSVFSDIETEFTHYNSSIFNLICGSTLLGDGDSTLAPTITGRACIPLRYEQEVFQINKKQRVLVSPMLPR